MFDIKHTYGKARTGILKLNSCKVQTPFFMPVATKGAVKQLTMHQLEDTNTECIISNAFILSLRPGVETIRKHGGIHKYMNWKKGIFTDSGGFQILSKDFLLKKSDKGVQFRDPYQGKKALFTPEDSVKIQNDLGSDVAMCFDEVPHYGKTKKDYIESVKRTTEWAKICKDTHANDKQLLFGIAQGGTFPELRKRSAEEINKIGFDGYALGGLCIGESKTELMNAVESQVSCFDIDKPKYIMGMGSPDDIVEAVARGADCFDSIYPTQNARRGSLFTKSGTIKIEAGKYLHDDKPIDSECKCYACQNHTRSYIHHMLTVHERLGMTLATIHNIYFMQKLMEEIQTAIKEQRFSEYRKDFIQNYNVKNKKNNRI